MGRLEEVGHGFDPNFDATINKTKKMAISAALLTIGDLICMDEEALNKADWRLDRAAKLILYWFLRRFEKILKIFKFKHGVLDFRLAVDSRRKVI